MFCFVDDLFVDGLPNCIGIFETAAERLIAAGCRSLTFYAPTFVHTISGCTFITFDEAAPLAVCSHKGSGNVVIMEPGVTAPAMIRINGSDNVVFIGADCDLQSSLIDVGASGGIVIVERDTQMQGGANIKLSNSGLIHIGSGCRLHRLAIVGNSDGHSICRRSTGERRNPDRDVVVGDNVVIEGNARIGKGSMIGSGSVVAEYSVVTGKIPPNCLVAGIPASVIEEDIFWSITEISSANHISMPGCRSE